MLPLVDSIHDPPGRKFLLRQVLPARTHARPLAPKGPTDAVRGSPHAAGPSAHLHQIKEDQKAASGGPHAHVLLGFADQARETIERAFKAPLAPGDAWIGATESRDSERRALWPARLQARELGLVVRRARRPELKQPRLACRWTGKRSAQPSAASAGAPPQGDGRPPAHWWQRRHCNGVARHYRHRQVYRPETRGVYALNERGSHGKDRLHGVERMLVMSRRLNGRDLRILPCAFGVALGYREFHRGATDAIIRMFMAKALQVLRVGAGPAKHERRKASR